jgi:hypothetical protein
MSRSGRLTKKQSGLLREIRQITTRLGLDPEKATEEDGQDKTIRLALIRERLIRGEVTRAYTMINEFIDCIICGYYFNHDPREPFTRQWRTRKFQRFNFHLLEKLYIMQKVDLVREITGMPTKIYKDIAAINDLRNALAHSFFTENLRRYGPRTAVYKSKDIFTLNGLEAFDEDFAAIFNWFDSFPWRYGRGHHPSGPPQEE